METKKELKDILEEIEQEFDRRINTQLKIMAGLEEDVYRYGYGKSLEAYQQGKLFVKDIICNHLNDGWIPTKERMPTKGECERDNVRFLISVGTDCCYSTEIAKCSWVEADNADGTDGSYSEFWIDQFPHIYRPSHRLIAAWKILELPEPYRPERSEGE